MTPQAASATSDSPAPLRPVVARAPTAPAAKPGAAAGFAAVLMLSDAPLGQAAAQQPAPEVPDVPGAPDAATPAGAPDPAVMPPAPGLMPAARMPSMDGTAKAMPSDASKGRQTDDATAAELAPEMAVPPSTSPVLTPLLQQAAAMLAARVPEPASAAGQDASSREPPVGLASVIAASGPADALLDHPAPAESAVSGQMAPDPAGAGSASLGRMAQRAAPALEAPQHAATVVVLAAAPTSREVGPEPSEAEGKPAEPVAVPLPLAGAAVLPAPAAPLPPSAAGPAPPAASHAQSMAGQLGPAFTTLAPTAGPVRLVVRLDPAELGQVQVGIARPADGPPRVELTAERPETLLLLMRDQPALHRALDLAGVPVEGRTLHFQLGTPEAPPSPAPQTPTGSGLGGGFGQGSGSGAGSGTAGSGRGPPQGWPGGADSSGTPPTARMRPAVRPQVGIDITA